MFKDKYGHHEALDVFRVSVALSFSYQTKAAQGARDWYYLFVWTVEKYTWFCLQDNKASGAAKHCLFLSSKWLSLKYLPPSNTIFSTLFSQTKTQHKIIYNVASSEDV